MTEDNVDYRSITYMPGSLPYQLYVTLTEEGPIYDAVGLDAERDEFAVTFSDGCVEIDTVKLNWLILTTEHLILLEQLAEQAERAWEIWCSSPAYDDFEIFDDPDSSDEATNAIRDKYKAELGVRVLALVQ